MSFWLSESCDVKKKNNNIMSSMAKQIDEQSPLRFIHCGLIIPGGNTFR